MRSITAKYPGACWNCGAHFRKGDTIGWQGRYPYCGECLAQHRRDLAADDFDLADNRCM